LLLFALLISDAVLNEHPRPLAGMKVLGFRVHDRGRAKDRVRAHAGSESMGAKTQPWRMTFWRVPFDNHRQPGLAACASAKRKGTRKAKRKRLTLISIMGYGKVCPAPACTS
jgi:hypothetical protein